ncbi:MAG: hypothetical protein LBU26_06600, partial [Synergistaceae bacterium]|nr:hypothetical protein [Synergistaceae bacterium]
MRKSSENGSVSPDETNQTPENICYIFVTLLREFVAFVLGIFFSVIVGNVGATLPFFVIALPGAIMGWKHAKTRYLPHVALSRYLPPLLPAVCALAIAVMQN